jgi:gas vesicle protein
MGNEFLGVIIGAFIAAAAGLLTTLFTSQQQRVRDKEARQESREWRVANYRRTLQEAKRKRLHEAYKVLLLAAWAWQSAVAEMQVVIAADQTTENRNKRVARYVAKALAPANEAMVAIELEDVGSDVAKIFFDLRKAYIGYMAGEGLRQQYAGTQSAGADMVSNWEGMQGDKKALDAKVDELMLAMQTRLRQLERTDWVDSGTVEESEKQR